MASVKYEGLFSPENSPCSDDNDQTIFMQNLIFIGRSDFFFVVFHRFKNFMVHNRFFLWSLYCCFTYDKYLKYIGNMKDIRRLSTIVITSVVYF